METSSVTGENVDAAFERLVTNIIGYVCIRILHLQIIFSLFGSSGAFGDGARPAPLYIPSEATLKRFGIIRKREVEKKEQAPESTATWKPSCTVS